MNYKIMQFKHFRKLGLEEQAEIFKRISTEQWRLERENAKLRAGLKKLRTLANGVMDDLTPNES